MPSGVANENAPICKICGAPTSRIGKAHGRHEGRDFQLVGCERCGLFFIEDPLTDFARVYDEAYYLGHGPDPLVDYVFELHHPEKTIRRYEWQGITDVVSHLTNVNATTSWLDFGCGNGGLVRYLRQHTSCQAIGFDEGAITGQARDLGVPIVNRSDLQKLAGTFDIVTAIEVLEHTLDPLEELQQIARMLRPGGLFFFTTGNADPFHNAFLRWPYLVPEIHISYFRPRTLDFALRETGMMPEYHGFIEGYENIIRYKVLKNLRVKNTSWFERVIPWRIVARAVDLRFRVTALPVGRKC